MESSTSNELEAILRRKAKELLAASRGPLCCTTRFPVGYELKSPEELKAAVSGCRATFVMFFGRECPYCRAFDPIFRHVGAKYSELANFVKAEVERFAYTAAALGVMGTPTTIAFVGGSPQGVLPGFAIAPVFESFVAKHLGEAQCRN